MHVLGGASMAPCQPCFFVLGRWYHTLCSISIALSLPLSESRTSHWQRRAGTILLVDVLCCRREEFEVLVQTILETPLMSGQRSGSAYEQCQPTYRSVDLCQAIRERKIYCVSKWIVMTLRVR